MRHIVKNVGLLYDDAKLLYDEVVIHTADNIISNLRNSIDVLKTNWEGKDAGVQIQNVIDVHNAMSSIRNILAGLAKDCSTIASNYREIQNANRANLDALIPIAISNSNLIEAYTDTRDTINISEEATDGMIKLRAAVSDIDTFITQSQKYLGSIMDNWQDGPGRGEASASFEEFAANANKYKETLTEVASSIDSAIKNYSF